MIQTDDGGYLLGGSRNSDPPNDSSNDIYLVKTDQDGNQEWYSIIGVDTISESTNCVAQTLDGGYIVCGSYWANSNDVNDIFLIKTNLLGAQEWRKRISLQEGMADHALSIYANEEGGYVICGNTQSYSSNYDDDALLIVTDELGEPISVTTFGNNWPWYEGAYHVIPTADDAYFLCGYQNNDGFDNNFYVVKNRYKLLGAFSGRTLSR